MNPHAEIFAAKRICPGSMNSKQWNAVPAWVRRCLFFSSRVEDKELLTLLRSLVLEALENGTSAADFVFTARRALKELTNPATGRPYNDAEHRASWTEEARAAYENSTEHIDSIARLKLILRTQSRLASGELEFRQQFEPFWVEMYPGMRFVRQAGALESYKRKVHIEYENSVHLKTDFAFWIAMNAAAIGGYELPHPPFGHNSWCWWEPVSRAECEALGLIKPGQQLTLSAADKEKWGIPITDPRELTDPARLAVVKEREAIIQHILNHPNTPWEAGTITPQPAPVSNTEKPRHPLELELDVSTEESSAEDDVLYHRCVQLVITERKASTSLLQRRLSIGYGKACKMMEALEHNGIIATANSSTARPREVQVPHTSP